MLFPNNCTRGYDSNYDSIVDAIAAKIAYSVWCIYHLYSLREIRDSIAAGISHAYVTADSELTAKRFCGIISSTTWQMETALSRGTLDNQTEYLRGEYFKVPGSSHYFPRRRLIVSMPRSMYYYHARPRRCCRRFRSFNNSARFPPFIWQSVSRLSAGV